MSARLPLSTSSPTRSFLLQRPNLPPEQSFDNQVKIGGEIRLACARGRWMGAQYEQATPRERGETPAHQFPEPSLHPITNHRRANRTADNKAYLCRVTGAYRSVRAGGQQQVTRDHGSARSAARSQRQPELRWASHPRLLRQHHTSCAAWRASVWRRRQPRQALSFARPLLRRAARTARPARVRIRSRKPWTFARRRLFGWNVRLLTGAPGAVLICEEKRARHRRAPAQPGSGPGPPRTQAQPVNGKGDASTGQTGPPAHFHAPPCDDTDGPSACLVLRQTCQRRLTDLPLTGSTII